MFEQNRIKSLSPFYNKVVEESPCAIIYFTVCVQPASIFTLALKAPFSCFELRTFRMTDFSAPIKVTKH